MLIAQSATVSARDSIHADCAIMLSLVRLYVCSLYVCPSVTRVDQSKALEVRIMQLSPQSNPFL